MKVLALEFSSPQRSVAVLDPATGRRFEAVDTTVGPAMKPFALIEAALQQAGLEREQIECIALGLGPGSYTGVRAAIAVGQGWQLARGVKLTGVSSVRCLANQAAADGLTGKFQVVIDAQRGEFYLAGYEVAGGKLREISPLQIVPMEPLRESERNHGLLIGPEVTRWFSTGRQVFPRAITLAQLALEQNEFACGQRLEPVYLRETTFAKAPPPRIS